MSIYGELALSDNSIFCSAQNKKKHFHNNPHSLNNYFYAVGDSHVRTFAGSLLFVPLFIGPGNRACFVTEECAQRTYELLRCNMLQIDHSKPVIFVFGEPDVRLHIKNIYDNKAWLDL